MCVCLCVFDCVCFLLMVVNYVIITILGRENINVYIDLTCNTIIVE